MLLDLHQKTEVFPIRSVVETETTSYQNTAIYGVIDDEENILQRQNEKRSKTHNRVLLRFFASFCLSRAT